MPDPNSFLPLSNLSFQILLALGKAPAHGYGIGKELAERTDGKLRPYALLRYGRRWGRVSETPSLLVLPILCLLGLPGVGNGQDVTWPEPGTQVRMFAPTFAADTIRGHILDLADSTMVLQSPSGRRLAVKYSDIVLLQTPLYGEYKRSILVGAASGAGLLTLLGAAFTGFAGSESTGTAVLTLAAAGAFVGGAIGAISGTRSVREWSTYYQKSTKSPEGASLGLSKGLLHRFPPTPFLRWTDGQMIRLPFPAPPSSQFVQNPQIMETEDVP